MKKFLTILLLLKFHILIAGMPPALVASQIAPDVMDGSAPNPFEGQAFNLWQYRSCGGSNFETDVIINGNDILFFGHISAGIPSPCPPHHYSSEVELNGLSAGVYNLEHYNVPSSDVFPPDPVDYPTYLVEQSQFTISPDRLLVSASSANAINSQTLPFEGQAFHLWDFVAFRYCIGIAARQVNYKPGNEIDVFILDEPIVGICPEQPPPVYIPMVDIDALESGHYHFNYYIVPEGNAFPPAFADYSNYFIERKAFEVLQAFQVDTLSLISLLSASIGLLIIGFVFLRKRL